MGLPPSLIQNGYLTPEQARRKAGSKLRRLMIATEGKADTGKTEFILSCPGPGIVLGLDRGFDAVFDNQTPPPARRDDFGFKVIQVSTSTQEQQPEYLKQWQNFRGEAYKAIGIPECLTVAIDGDSDSWEIQRLGEHGKLTGVFPQTRYSDVYAARRGFYYRLWDSGKIIIATNKVRDEYRDVLDAHGNPVKDPQNPAENKRERTGDHTAQGFPDQEYLWQIRLRHLFKAAHTLKIGTKTVPIPKQWGIRILKCKANMDLIGQELWGDDCNFTGLVQTVYPHIPLTEWGL